MRAWIKPALYVALISIGIWAAAGFYREFQSSTEAVKPVQTGPGEPDLLPRKHNAAAQGRMMMYGGVLLGVVMGLGLLVSRAVSGWVGEKTTDLIYNDNLEGVHNPDYDYAEQVVLSGDPLEAVRLMRELFKRNPHEIYIQLRIAELYENELDNPLAAALEYEEVLKCRFHPERWGWAAIHLVNLYSGKLQKPDQAMAWLKRIALEHPETNPARKARERLADNAPSVESVADVPSPAPPPPSTGGLPPGFSPKKR